jgi:predicted nucleic acid-binding protein
MSAISAFFDTNVIIYLATRDPRKAGRAEEVLEPGGVVSVQVLNEVADVSRRKFKMEWFEIRDVLMTVRAICRVDPSAIGVHEHGLAIAERYGFRIYDGLIVAAAIAAGCDTLFSEDMQDGQKIGSLTIRNPFAGL